MKWDKGAHPDMDNASIEKTLMEDLDKPGAKVQDTGDPRRPWGKPPKRWRPPIMSPLWPMPPWSR